MLVYLHAREHQDVDTFCREVLTSEVLLRFLLERDFVVWGGSVYDSEPYQGEFDTGMLLV